MQETQVQSLSQEDPLEKEMAAHSNILAWRIPWTEEPGGLQSMGVTKGRIRLSEGGHKKKYSFGECRLRTRKHYIHNRKQASDQIRSVAQSCPTLCDPMDCIVHGILYAVILEWVAFPFSRAFSQARDQNQVSPTAGRFFAS